MKHNIYEKSLHDKIITFSKEKLIFVSNLLQKFFILF